MTGQTGRFLILNTPFSFARSASLRASPFDSPSIAQGRLFGREVFVISCAWTLCPRPKLRNTPQLREPIRDFIRALKLG